MLVTPGSFSADARDRKGSAPADWLAAVDLDRNDLPVRDFAPGDARQCYELTLEAFAWAEPLRTPVVILSDKEVGMTLESLDVAALPRASVTSRRAFAGSGRRYVPYACERPDEPPEFAPVGGVARVVATGSSHDRAGRLRKNSPETIEILARLQAKITAHAAEMSRVEAEPDVGAETLVIGYGITARAGRQACRRLRAEGRRVSFLQPLTLFPVPTPRHLYGLPHSGCRALLRLSRHLQSSHRAMKRLVSCEAGSARLEALTRNRPSGLK